MPPSESLRRAGRAARARQDDWQRAVYTEADEVEEYIRSRREIERVRRASVGADVLSADADFTWEMLGERRGDRLRTGDADLAEVLDLPVNGAWTAAAAARHARPRGTERSLDAWGERVSQAESAPVTAPRGEARSSLAPATRATAATAGGARATQGRRTVVITGRGAERYPVPRRGYSASLRPHERAGFKPDRLALWAVVLCLALLLGAVATSHAAVLVAVAHATPHR